MTNINKATLIKQAVISHKGKWPNESYDSIRFGENGATIFKSEFNAAADRMREKPDWKDAPDWASHLAQDSNGPWYWYSSPPSSGYLGWYAGGKCAMSQPGKCIGDWRNTLEKRPEQHIEVKENADNWFERGESPPVGIECEYDTGVRFCECKIVAINGSAVAFTCEENENQIFVSTSEEARFRPIRTEREKAIDAAKDVANFGALDDIFGDLYDAGFLRLPEEK